MSPHADPFDLHHFYTALRRVPSLLFRLFGKAVLVPRKKGKYLASAFRTALVVNCLARFIVSGVHVLYCAERCVGATFRSIRRRAQHFALPLWPISDRGALRAPDRIFSLSTFREASTLGKLPEAHVASRSRGSRCAVNDLLANYAGGGPPCAVSL